MTTFRQWPAELLSRRDFLGVVGAVGTVALSGISCSAGNSGGGVVSPDNVGSITGQVTNLQGVPQPMLGTLILMYGSGRQVGKRADADSNGRFAFGQIPPGQYQIRFNAPGLATVPEPFDNPVRFSVVAGKTTDVPVRVHLGNYDQSLVEIYIGDGFFQMQPDGLENGEAVVKLGSNVCWYNVDSQVHTVTGGPWGDSGDLQKTQAYLWPATQAGVFTYQCRYHQPQERGTLRVVL